MSNDVELELAIQAAKAATLAHDEALRRIRDAREAVTAANAALRTRRDAIVALIRLGARAQELDITADSYAWGGRFQVLAPLFDAILDRQIDGHRILKREPMKLDLRIFEDDAPLLQRLKAEAAPA